MANMARTGWGVEMACCTTIRISIPIIFLREVGFLLTEHCPKHQVPDRKGPQGLGVITYQTLLDFVSF